MINPLYRNLEVLNSSRNNNEIAVCLSQSHFRKLCHRNLRVITIFVLLASCVFYSYFYTLHTSMTWIIILLMKVIYTAFFVKSKRTIYTFCFDAVRERNNESCKQSQPWSRTQLQVSMITEPRGKAYHARAGTDRAQRTGFPPCFCCSRRLSTC